MITKITETLKRDGKTIKGKILLSEFSGKGRGFARLRLNDRFLILSTNYPKIEIFGFYNDYIMALHVWGLEKEKDNIEINKEFPNEEIAIDFMQNINKIRI